MEIREGDRIRVDCGCHWMGPDLQDFTVESFRGALGIFQSENDRTASRFTPLCKLYEAGPDSEVKYIPNYGEYTTNLVPAFMQIPK